MNKQHKISIEINATPDAAWKIIGAVGGVNEWLEPIKTCRVDGNKRYCETDHGNLVEDITKVDHDNRELHYAIPEQSMIPVKHIVGMMKVENGKDGKAMVTWQWNFDVEEHDEAKAVEMLTGIGTMGIHGIENLIAKQKK